MTISFHAMRANLLANATAASLGGLRLRMSISQGDARPLQPTACLITAVAPDTSTARKASSPARVMTPSLTLPAVEWSLGVNPIQAANWRPDRNSSGAGVFIISNAAPIGPIPGILARRRLHSSALCQAMSLAEISAICSSS